MDTYNSTFVADADAIVTVSDIKCHLNYNERRASEICRCINSPPCRIFLILAILTIVLVTTVRLPTRQPTSQPTSQPSLRPSGLIANSRL
jgi:hypothetical protein